MTAHQPPRDAASDAAVIRDLAARLLTRVDDLARAFATTIVTHEPVYAERYDFDEVVRASVANIGLMLRALANPGAPQPTSASEATGRRNAERGVPLESLLHLYRMASRMIWDELLHEAIDAGPEQKDALLFAGAEVWELTDRFSAVVTRSYHDTEVELARRGDERRAALVEALLSGTASPPVAREAAAAFGITEGDVLRVVALPAATASVRDVEQRLRKDGIASAWRRSGEHLVGVLAGEPDDERTRALLKRLLSGRVGCSPAFTSLGGVAAAAEHAELALHAARDDDVALLDEHLPAALLVRSPDLAERLVQRVLRDVARSRDGEELLNTFQAWQDAGGSVDAVAAALYVHRNTVFNRLRRLQERTGRRLDRPSDVVELSLALRARRLLAVVRATNLSTGARDAATDLPP